jgi:galactokinase
VSTAFAALKLAGLTMDPQRMALLCQKAEHEYAHVPCGIMDQTIVAAGQIGHAMLMDCRDLSKKFIPIDPNELRVVIVNSMVKHALSGSEYPDRQRQCQEGVEYFRKLDPLVRALRDVTLEQLEKAKGKLPDVVYRRCRHVISENARTTEAATKLEGRMYEQVGELMVASHRSLEHDYEVSVPELDYLVEQSVKIKGVYGARMTGAGFGGCIVALVQPRYAESYAKQIQSAYSSECGKTPGAFITTATAGVSLVE